MAKLSSVNKNERRKKLVKKYAGRYASLKAKADDKSLDDSERLMARLKMAEIPRNGNPTRQAGYGGAVCACSGRMGKHRLASSSCLPCNIEQVLGGNGNASQRQAQVNVGR